MTFKSIGVVPWSRQDMIDKLEEFAYLYEQRPLMDIGGSMRPPHLFLVWFVLGYLQPEVIVESGVLLGRGTWFLEQACPDARFYCIEPNLDAIQYRPKNATYFAQDFSTLDWSHLPGEETILFFDDHQNAFERVKQAQRCGLPRMIFEDNYPADGGDCYSLKKVFAHAGSSHQGVAPNALDARYLEGCLKTYCELPPVFDPIFKCQGRVNRGLRPATPAPLLHSQTEPYQQIFLDDAHHYYWMCYVELRREFLVEQK